MAGMAGVVARPTETGNPWQHGPVSVTMTVATSGHQCSGHPTPAEAALYWSQLQLEPCEYEENEGVDMKLLQVEVRNVNWVSKYDVKIIIYRVDIIFL